MSDDTEAVPRAEPRPDGSVLLTRRSGRVGLSREVILLSPEDIAEVIRAAAASGAIAPNPERGGPLMASMEALER